MPVFDSYPTPLPRESDGRITWPLHDRAGRQMQRSTRLRIEQVLWCLAHRPGHVLTSKSGQATGELLSIIGPSPARWEGPNRNPDRERTSDVGNLSQILLFLDRAGLIHRTVNGRRTTRIKLLEPVELLPGTDPYVEPETEPEPEPVLASVPDPEPEPAPEPEPERVPMGELVEAKRAEIPAPVGLTLAPSPADALANAAADLGVAGLARALLDEVVAVLSSEVVAVLASERASEPAAAPTAAPAAPVADAGSTDAGWIRAQRDEATAKLKRSERKVASLESDLAVKAGLVKSLQHQLAEVVAERDRIAANLDAVLASAREAAATDEQTRRDLDRVMRTVPGFERYSRQTPPPPPRFHAERAAR